MKGSTSAGHSEVPVESIKDNGINLEEEKGESSEERSSAAPQNSPSIPSGKQDKKISARDDAEQRKDEKTDFAASTLSTMEKAAYARREIFDLWAKVSEWEEERMAVRYHRTSDVNDVVPIGLRTSATQEGGGDKNIGKTENDEPKEVKSKDNEEDEEEAIRRYDALQHLLHKYKLNIRTPLEEDVGRGLGDALDRLILLCVPLPPMRYGGGGDTQVSHPKQEKGGRDSKRREEGKQENENSGSGTGVDTEDPLGVLLQVLQIASRQGRRLSVRLVQHLFARTSSYTEALSVFHTLRRAHFAMNMETYHAMLYSLQRLEEEGWAKRFQEEYLQRQKFPARGKESSCRSGAVDDVEAGEVSRQKADEPREGLSEQALEFILRGVESPLLPENKPWIGQIMYGNGAGGREKDEEEVLHSMKGEGVAAASTAAGRMRQTAKSWDELGQLWVKRYKQR